MDVFIRETTATILLARKRETNILMMIELQLSCLQRRQKRNGKYNDETQHLGQPQQDDGVGDQMWLARHMEPPEEEFIMIVVAIYGHYA